MYHKPIYRDYKNIVHASKSWSDLNVLVL